MNGDSTAGMITFDSTDWPLTASNPAAAAVAPITPPTRACDELDGNPKYQVNTFQAIAPSSQAKMIGNVTWAESTIPLAIVAATDTDKNAPTRFSTPDNATAALGRSAPVAIDVAIALAVSWKPFVKSNATAVRITITRSAVLCILHAFPLFRATTPRCGLVHQ